MESSTTRAIKAPINAVQAGAAETTHLRDRTGRLLATVYPTGTFTSDEVAAAIVAFVNGPDETHADDPSVDRLVSLIERSLANGGCSNCGGLPHTTTCRVGRLDRAFKAAPVQVEGKPEAPTRERPSDDGGPAYPISGGHNEWNATGMSVRDRFAETALAGLITRLDEVDIHVLADQQAVVEDALVAQAYRFADAMIERRKR